MINQDLGLLSQAQHIMVQLAMGDLTITHVYDTDLSTPARDDARCWLLDTRTDHGHRLSFHMEGRNIHNLIQCVMPDGQRLLPDKSRYAALEGLTIDTKNNLENVVLAAYDQAQPAQ